MSELVKSPADQMGSGTKGGPGKYDGDDVPGGYKRTSSPNGVPEKIFDGHVEAPKNPDIVFSPAKPEKKG